MMKKAICYFLVLVFFSSQLNGLFTFVDFKINQDYIAKFLCIDKEKPMSTCNGKCHLSKQLKKQEKKEQKEHPQGSREKNEVLFSDDFQVSPAIDKNLFSQKHSPHSKHLDFSSQGFIEDIFHPPRLV